MHSSSEANELDVSTNQREDESSTANKKLIEFIHDLNEAIQNGNFSFSQSCSSSSNANNQQKNFMQQCNVDNLSNQTFSYIINWLKQHQLKYDNESTNNCNKVSIFGFIHKYKSFNYLSTFLFIKCPKYVLLIFECSLLV